MTNKAQPAGEALTDALRELVDAVHCGRLTADICGSEGYINAVVARAEAALASSPPAVVRPEGWISVEDQLPPFGRDVITFVTRNVGRPKVLHQLSADPEVWFDDDTIRWRGITHWMPLPEPPGALGTAAVVQPDLTAFDKAVADELHCVSPVAYNSHEICKWFAKNVRDRLALGTAKQVTEPSDFEKAARLMNETGQGEHLGVSVAEAVQRPVDDDILDWHGGEPLQADGSPQPWDYRPGPLSKEAAQRPADVAIVAERTGLSPRQVYTLHATGALRGYRFGRAVRFAEEDVTEYIQLCRSIASKTLKAAIASSSSSPVASAARGSGLESAYRLLGLEPTYSDLQSHKHS